jgi:hypothetical protein
MKLLANAVGLIGGWKGALLALGGLAVAGGLVGLLLMRAETKRLEAVRAIYEDGFRAGESAQALKTQTAALAEIDRRREEEAAREAQTAARIKDAEERAARSARERAAALAAARRNDARLDQCLTTPYPDALRGALPRAGLLGGLRDEA